MLGKSRGAVIGKAFRIGLKKGRPVAKDKKQKPLPKKIKEKKPHVYAYSLIELKDYQCRAFDDGMYCGHPIERGSFCAVHAEKYYTKKALPRSEKQEQQRQH